MWINSIMDILLSHDDKNIRNYNIIHLNITRRSDRLYNNYINIVKCVYNIIQNIDYDTIKTIIVFDNFIKHNPTSNVSSVCPEDIFQIDYMNNYFKKYNIVFMSVPKIKLEILKIEYGLKGIKMVDLTDKIKEQCVVGSDYFCIPEKLKLNNLCDKDPVPNSPKKLYLHYKVNDKYFLASQDELNLKLVDKLEIDLMKNIQLLKKNIEIIKIEYGIKGKNVIDVTNKIKPHLSFNTYHVTFSKEINLNLLCEDPVLKQPKHLYIFYRYGDDTLSVCLDEFSSRLTNNFIICGTPKIQTSASQIENFKIKYEENDNIPIDITELKKKYYDLGDVSFSIKEDFHSSSIYDLPKTDVNKKIAIEYKINSHHFSILAENFNIALTKNLNVKILNEEDNIVKQINNHILFKEIANEIKFVNFHNENATNYLQNFANSSYYSKINIIHLMVGYEVAPFYKSNNMTFENYKTELNKKYYSLLDKYLKPSADEITIIFSSEPDNIDFKEYLDFRLFNNVFIDKNCIDLENIQILALLLAKSCNNIFIGNYNCNKLQTSVASNLILNLVPETTRKILIDLHDLTREEILI